MPLLRVAGDQDGSLAGSPCQAALKRGALGCLCVHVS